MKVSVETKPNSEAVLSADVTWDEMEKASDKAYRKLVKEVDIQGFRRGKAPRSLLERRLGKEYIYQEGLDDLISEAYSNALKEHNLTPITQPQVDAPVFEMGQDYHFSMTIPVVTPAKLPDYHDLHFEREDATVTSEEVDQELESFQSRLAEWSSVERPVEYGDRIKADLKLTSGDQKISDLKDNTFEIAKERPGLFSGMDEHIIGMKPGESKSFTTTIPEDYSNEKYAGKEATYELTLHSVEAKDLPTIDDEFAKKVSDDQFDNVEDLRRALGDNILERKKRASTEELREKVVNALIEKTEFTLHPLLVDEEIHNMEHQFGHMLEQQHLTLDQYLTMTKKSHEEYHEELRPDAEQRVKRELVLEAFAEQENITVEPSEIEALFNAYEQIGQPLPKTQDQIRSLMISFRREKALSRLVEVAAGPDPDEEQEEEELDDSAEVEGTATEEANEEADTIANAEAAATVGEEAAAQPEAEEATPAADKAEKKAATSPSEPDAKDTETVE